MGELLDLVTQHYANFSERDWERDRQIFSPDVVTVDPSGRLDGIEAFLAHEAGFATAFPDARIEFHRGVEQGELVMAEGAFVGTHTGPLPAPGGEIPPTGHTLRLEFADVFTVRGGQLLEHRLYYDQVAFLTQLGLMPAPSAA
jgi:predicted ester cyclase